MIFQRSIIAALVLVLVGCGSAKSGDNSVKIADNEAIMARLNGKFLVVFMQDVTVSENDSAQVHFDNIERRVAANLGCNNVNGSYQVQMDSITFDPHFMATRMYCEGKMALEDQFNNVFPGQSFAVSFAGNEVHLYNRNGAQVLQLKKR